MEYLTQFLLEILFNVLFSWRGERRESKIESLVITAKASIFRRLCIRRRALRYCTANNMHWPRYLNDTNTHSPNADPVLLRIKCLQRLKCNFMWRVINKTLKTPRRMLSDGCNQVKVLPWIIQIYEKTQRRLSKSSTKNKFRLETNFYDPAPRFLHGINMKA
jgi:hypothetical protein